ncbi:MAG: hypothetical protein KDG50_08855 [Chromatiales bacterium]|nr:hypothetical protein [Chromatiales bacterium]
MTGSLIVMLAGAPPAQAAEVVVSRDGWVAGMQDLLPRVFCEDGSYFRSCFSITADACHAKASATTETCLKQVAPKLPDELRQPEDGRTWGQQVGRCAGGNFERELLPKRLNSPKCNDPSQWQ